MALLPATVLGGYQRVDGRNRIPAIIMGLGAYPRIISALVFVAVYFLAILYCYSHNFRDPTSVFWDPGSGYDKAYSLYREAEAEAFIGANNAHSSDPRTSRPSNATVPELCLGIATIARPNIQYIQKTVGSVLQGLGAEERDRLHFIFFIAHTDPAVHPISGEPWTVNLPDTLLEYDKSDQALLDKIKEWEKSGNHRDKGFYDYTYLLKACQHTGTSHIAMLEGDVIAAPGWFQRSVDAALQVDGDAGWRAWGEHAPKGASSQQQPAWLYIRMFWTETYLGWNSEEWPSYAFYSGITWAALVGGMLLLRTYAPRTRPALDNGSIAIASCVCLPACILLYFAAGRMSVQPPSPGIRRMEDFGCCSQGMIFRAEQVPTIVDAIERRIEGYMDMLLETLATQEGLQRWAIFPSLLQHIGGESSKGDAVADERARMIWNFAFERYGQVLEAGRSLWRCL